MIHGPASYAEARALAERMAASPADAVSFAGKLAELVQNLPPQKSELLSRYIFDRPGLWTLVASFENVETGPEAPPQIIRIQHDVWIRGVVGVAIPQLPIPSPDDFGLMLSQQCRFTTNNRDKFECNWRIDARQGFVGTGAGEILAPATLVTGDGFYVAPLDWRLQKDQYIEVRLRSRFPEFIPAGLVQDPDALVLRWALVCFWAEELNQPSVR